MRQSARNHHFFDTRSVMLFAALTMGGGVALQARAADGAPPSAAASKAQPAPAANPANRPPAMAHKNTPPPMTTSPAFGPAPKAEQSGAAQNPDVRPSIAATMPTEARTAFDRADSNGDGTLSASEAERLPAISARFSTLDTNHDGVLSADEFRAGARN